MTKSRNATRSKTRVSARRRTAAAAGALLGLLAAAPAGAIVQGQPDSAAGRHAVMVLSNDRRGAQVRVGQCTGVVLSPTIVLTAAHCVTGATAYAIHSVGADGRSVLIEPTTIAVHPQYVATQHRKTVDLALVRLREALPASFTPTSLADSGDLRQGDLLTVGGYGLGRDGDSATGGQFRTARLGVIEPYGRSTILVWLTDPATGRSRNGAGACGGDSGGPIFDRDGRVVAITAFAEGAGKTHCGALTQGVLVAPQRAWIDGVVAGWR